MKREHNQYGNDGKSNSEGRGYEGGSSKAPSTGTRSQQEGSKEASSSNKNWKNEEGCPTCKNNKRKGEDVR